MGFPSHFSSFARAPALSHMDTPHKHIFSFYGESLHVCRGGWDYSTFSYKILGTLWSHTLRATDSRCILGTPGYYLLQAHEGLHTGLTYFSGHYNLHSLFSTDLLYLAMAKKILMLGLHFHFITTQLSYRFGAPLDASISRFLSVYPLSSFAHTLNLYFVECFVLPGMLLTNHLQRMREIVSYSLCTLLTTTTITSPISHPQGAPYHHHLHNRMSTMDGAR